VEKNKEKGDIFKIAGKWLGCLCGRVACVAGLLVDYVISYRYSSVDILEPRPVGRGGEAGLVAIEDN
jgi:5,10-methenyltetrahydromethanopterin hydrogenase